jgi:membrane protease YdiL (CAAX protease family)
VSFEPGHGYEAVVALLRVYEASLPLLALAASTVSFCLLPALAIAGAISLWPKWTPPWRLFVGAAAIPFLLLATGIVLTFMVDGIEKMERPGVIGRTMLWYLVEPLYLVPGAMVALAIRRMAFWSGEKPAAVAEELDAAAEERRQRAARSLEIRHGFIVGLALTAMAFLVFCFVNTQPHPNMIYFNKLLAKYPVEAKFPLILGRMLGALLMEEFAWRAIFQTTLILMLRDKLGRRGAVFAAILLSSFFWALTHPRSFNFAWAKYLQIMPLGLLLGWLMEKRGLMSCVVAHGLFNACAMMFKLLGGDFVGLFGYEKPIMLPLDDFPLPGEEG